MWGSYFVVHCACVLVVCWVVGSRLPVVFVICCSLFAMCPRFVLFVVLCDVDCVVDCVVPSSVVLCVL